MGDAILCTLLAYADKRMSAAPMTVVEDAVLSPQIGSSPR
jgi:hypothetical protein